MTHNSTRGQGLMETIVALGVIMTGLISVMSLTVSNLNGQRDAATRYQAVNLAREGLELIRGMRDNNWIAGLGAWAGIVSGTDLPLQFDPASTSAAVVGGSGEQTIKGCEDGHFAQNTPTCSTETPYRRTVTIVPRDCTSIFTPAQCTQIKKSDPIALTATAKVTWQNAEGGEREVTLSETFYDWR